MANHVEKLKKRALEISETKHELKEQNKINISDLSIIDELFSIPLQDDSELPKVKSLSKTVDTEKDIIFDAINENKKDINETSNETDDFITGLKNNVRILEQMEKTSNLVNIKQQVSDTEKRIDELEEVKCILETGSNSYSTDSIGEIGVFDNEIQESRDFKDNGFDAMSPSKDELLPYAPVASEFENQQMLLREQYDNETDSHKKEQIRAISELLSLESSLNLSNGDPDTPQIGGLHGDNHKRKPPGWHSHHIPPKSVSNNNINVLPAVCLTDADHRLTASYGGRMSSKSDSSLYTDLGLTPPDNSLPYKDELIMQINNGNYSDAFRNEVFELKKLFGDKYDGAIKQAIVANRKYLQEYGNPKVKGNK